VDSRRIDTRGFYRRMAGCVDPEPGDSRGQYCPYDSCHENKRSALTEEKARVFALFGVYSPAARATAPLLDPRHIEEAWVEPGR
jgi:hypothetical protein